MLDDYSFEIMKLCSILHRRNVFELQKKRETDRTYYYRSKKRILLQKKAPGWALEVLEIDKKINDARISKLNVDKKALSYHKKTSGVLCSLLKKIGATVTFVNGSASELVVDQKIGYVIKKEMFESMADQWEANKALEKILR
jgi:hypothetical protein